VARIRLDSLGAVTAEMGRLYREARSGKVDPATAAKLISEVFSNCAMAEHLAKSRQAAAEWIWTDLGRARSHPRPRPQANTRPEKRLGIIGHGPLF